MRLTAVLVLAVCACGCTRREVYFVPPTVPVRLVDPVRGARVEVKEAATGRMVHARADLLPGSWVLVDPAEYDTAERARLMGLEREHPRDELPHPER